jgi:hypothetical protein
LGRLGLSDRYWRGTIDERDFSSGDFNDPPTYPGAVLARGLEECRGRSYYTEVVAEVPPDAVYVPEKASQLTTPCRSFDEIQREEGIASANESEGQPAAHASFFYTPSHNIGCALSPEGVRCDISEKSWTPPPKPGDCNLDWGNSVSVGANGGPTILCAGDSLFGGHYMVLPYGEFIARGEISCLSRMDGLICINEEEEGFFLSYQKISLF